MRLLYFSWIRERIGKEAEDVELPAEVTTVAQLLDWLRGRGEEYAWALEHPSVVRVALDMEHVQHDEPLGNPAEVALFPPMTGG